MTVILGSVDAVLIATTTNPVLQVQGTNQMIFLKVTACNTDTDTRAVTIWRAPSGGSPATGELLWDAQPLKAGATQILPFSGKTLTANQQLFASASVANVVNLSIDWLEPSS